MAREESAIIEKPKKALGDFKKFILRGNVIDLAIGVVIGAAFGTIVSSLVKDVITPLLSLVHLPDFSRATVDVGRHLVNGKLQPRATIRYGNVVNAVISFLVISAFVFFFVVRPLNRLLGRDADEKSPQNHECPHCLSSIPVKAAVCSFCGRDVRPKRTTRSRR
jgi:large conductance mechanosensitive channel